MKISSYIIKNISSNKDEFFKILIGSIYDENEERYSEVYKYEFDNFLNNIENDLRKLEKSNIEIEQKVLKYIFICNNFLNSEDLNINELEEYINNLIELSKRDFTNKDFSLNKKEEEFISQLLSKNAEQTEKLLIDFYLEQEDNNFIIKFKNKEHYDNIIHNLKEEYITTLNLLYKLYNKKPSDWSTREVLHKKICEAYEIERERFIF